jgi:heme/copper-type cytochrome/quinol oxidase subunit 1
MVIPFHPFSEIPPIMVGGGPGQWLVVAYLLYVSAGGGAFGWLSGLLRTIEKEENREINPSLMWPGFLMLFLGVTVSCVSLGYAGATGGYASIIEHDPTPLRQMLSPYVYPVTAAVIAAVAGAVLVLLAMIRAKGP